MTILRPLLPLALAALVHAIYNPVRQYAGNDFFNGWQFYDNVDNTTWGNVTYLGSSPAFSQQLTYVNVAGNAVLKVDNTTTVQGPSDQVPFIHRNSVRITTSDTYGMGNLVIIDVVHLPYGCSVWPSFWTLGTGVEWPNGGEIDIIESINLATANQMALHTNPGCVQNVPQGSQTGSTLEGDCNNARGCLVSETKPNSVGSGFAQAGGGVWALQMDIAGFYIWFWSRPDIPNSIKSSTAESSVDLSDWGTPTAAYPAAGGCNLGQFFTPQQLILDITLCGAWAGLPDVYSSTCHTPGNNCVYDNIIGPGSPTYDTAYFEISYVRTYEVANGSFTGTGTTTPAATQTTPGASASASAGGGAVSNDPFSDGALTSRVPAAISIWTMVLLLTFWICLA